MTQPPKAEKQHYNFEAVYKDMSSAPVFSPNVIRLSGVAGTIYLDLGFVDPFDILEASKKNQNPAILPKASAKPLGRVIMPLETARQLLILLKDQIEVQTENTNQEK